MKRLNKKGFTLIELLAVIVILAIVAAVSMTVIVPMINGQAGKGAESSAKNMISQVIGACQDTLTTDIMAPSHGTFPTDAAYATCATGTCTDVTFSATQLQAMNISGEMPNSFTATLTNCNITKATIVFTEGQFAGYTVSLNNGKYTTTK